MATKLERSYTLPSGKTISGIATAIKNYFNTLQGVAVCATQKNFTAWTITCKNKDISGLAQKAVGCDINATVYLVQTQSAVTVRFEQKINEIVRVKKAVFTLFLPLGIASLYGVKKRHDIPSELHKVIWEYLNTK